MTVYEWKGEKHQPFFSLIVLFDDRRYDFAVRMDGAFVPHVGNETEFDERIAYADENPWRVFEL